MADDDLARRVRDYARDRANKPLFADGGMCVSSAWLAREFGVDSRTVAAALRPFGIRPAVVERGVRGYVVADLAGIRFDDDDRAADIGRLRTAFDMPERPAGSRQSVDAAEFGDILRAEADAIEPDAVTAWAADAFAAAFATAIVVDPADLPEQVDGVWRCGRCKTPMVGTGRCLSCWPPPPDAISRLSAGAGHDMTPALKAAGLL